MSWTRRRPGRFPTPTWPSALHDLGGAISQLQGWLLALVADAEQGDVATMNGAANTAAWLRAQTGLTGTECAQLVRTATALDDRHGASRKALLEGSITLSPAQAVVASVDALPSDLSSADRERAERHLLDQAQQHDARALRQLGRHLLEVVAPDVADAHLAQLLEREERDARRSASLRIWDDGNGSTSGRFKIPRLHGDMLQTMLEAIANPARPDPLVRSERNGPDVRGEALCELIERYPVDRLPLTGGVNATVVVTIPVETLTGGLRAAGLLGSGSCLSPGEARRLACVAGVLPAVLDGRSEVLDLGRRRRLHSKAQRTAMALRQGGCCGIEDCERPAAWCDAHHVEPWSAGGKTSTTNGVLLCPRHHTLAHSSGLEMRRSPRGQSLRFHRRT